MTDIAELERRVSALEEAQNHTAKSQNWMAGTLGRIAAVQDDHTARLGRIEKEVSALRRDLPGIIAETMREVLRDGK